MAESYGNNFSFSLASACGHEDFILHILHIDSIPRAVGEMVLKNINRVILDIAQIQCVSRYSFDDLNLSSGPAPGEECGNKNKEKNG